MLSHPRYPSVNMVWCTYCGKAFSRAEHLDRHVMTRKCLFCLNRFQFLTSNRYQCQAIQMSNLLLLFQKTVCPKSHIDQEQHLTIPSDLLQRHYFLVHKEAEEQSSDQENNSSQRRPIACVACARAKTKCDKFVSSCFPMDTAHSDYGREILTLLESKL
jgi:hypothetical protein